MSRKTALVVCPGRGTYNAAELGYLVQHHGQKTALIASFDAVRHALGQESIAALDAAEKFSLSKYSRGDNASGLIYACSYADFLDIDHESFEIVAVTGNSMGWYTALACAGAVTPQAGFQIVNTMGSLMHEAMIGGQVLYPFVDNDWCEIPGEKDRLLGLSQSIEGLFVSIHLGGMIVFAGEEAALTNAESQLEKRDRYPMRLAGHAAFHTPLQEPVAGTGRERLDLDLFDQPEIPLIDGRGHVWLPGAQSVADLRSYTLGHQVTQPYDFTRAISHGLKEFAPDVLIILGPGTTLGGAAAQGLIAERWIGLASKHDFKERQTTDPFMLSIGLDRSSVTP